MEEKLSEYIKTKWNGKLLDYYVDEEKNVVMAKYIKEKQLYMVNISLESLK